MSKINKRACRVNGYNTGIDDKTRPLTSARMIDKTDVIDELVSDSSWKKRLPRDSQSIISTKFDSLNEFIDELVMDSYEGDYDWFNRVAYHRNTGKYSNFETTMDINSRQKLMKCINNGYTSPKLWKYYTDTKNKIMANPDNISKLGSIGVDCRRKRQRDLSGAIINIDKYMGGEECMETMKRQNSQRCIRLFIDYSQSCSEDAMRLTKKSIIAVAICQQLETLGFATEIYFGDCSTMRNPSQDFDRDIYQIIQVWSVLAKPSGFKIDETNLCNYALTGIFRDLYFDWARNCLGTSGGIGIALYHDIPPYKHQEFYKAITDCDVYIGHADKFSSIITNVVGVIQEGE